jgi:hypothetical protein
MEAVRVRQDKIRFVQALQAVVGPFEPPLPGKVTAEQALKFAESLARRA